MILPSLARRGVLLSILSATAIGGGHAAAQGRSTAASRRPAIKALAFDGFTLLDPRPVSAAMVQLLPEKGAQLAAAWANKLFALS
jgi:2-haloacid dehalogenase